ncbi:DUF4435 domain-containing protein [Bacteroides sp. 519]|uniref:DUF4435 domain-containing protein n=1 Tax=Bacteroides sp. 519 TaxID=2302937 RepID=UPI0013D4B823|nr:DUF4435 domain-containing protein [Bacteroides sp. 519]NDV57890.1 DUF4435 domain-containing protein [Bacteroides sp. 519]
MQTNRDVQKHYSSLAQYYSNIPTLLRKCKAVIHLEDKTDERFWRPFFERYFPNETFQFLPYSQNEKGNNTSGCEQCLKFKPYLNKNFLICIDSDYRYLLQEPNIDIDHFIFQTYTYSLENHFCISHGLNLICKLSCKYDNEIYDFEDFLKKYSAVIYELFLWHIALFRNNPEDFNEDEFCSLIKLPHVYNSIDNQSDKLLNELKQRVTEKIESLKRTHLQFSLETEKRKYAALGLTEENTYLYIRGHNLFSMCNTIGKKVCDKILEIEKGKLKDSSQIGILYNSVDDFEKVISHNILFGTYPEIIRIENDMRKYIQANN